MLRPYFNTKGTVMNLRSEHLQFAVMLIPTFVMFVFMSLAITAPDAPQAASAAGQEIQETVVMDTETVQVGTVVLR